MFTFFSVFFVFPVFWPFWVPFCVRMAAAGPEARLYKVLVVVLPADVEHSDVSPASWGVASPHNGRRQLADRAKSQIRQLLRDLPVVDSVKLFNYNNNNNYPLSLPIADKI